MLESRFAARLPAIRSCVTLCQEHDTVCPGTLLLIVVLITCQRYPLTEIPEIIKSPFNDAAGLQAMLSQTFPVKTAQMSDHIKGGRKPAVRVKEVDGKGIKGSKVLMLTTYADSMALERQGKPNGGDGSWRAWRSYCFHISV